MDTTGFSQVGRHGTLSLLKRRSTTPSSNQLASPNDVITSFGIDESPLTFGSTSTCGVRLYYSDVDPLHCQLVFEDGKAFLAVMGQGGVLVDGCWVYPHSSSSGSNATAHEQEHQQTIIPLSNNSEFEIHHKRFRFAYPPKEIRKTLLATPAPAQKRALRLSMIHSAQVFSPRPSKDPRENLRILQSPLKQGIFPPRTPGGGKTPTRPRAVSPLKYSSKPDSSSDDSDSDEEEKPDEEDQEEGEEEIVLVHTNHPRVVEEELDLVILEDVPFGPPPAPRIQAPTPVQAAPQPQPPRTPRRKSLGGTALHRAVLIRSAQRAVWRAEKEKEEEEEREEEMEVLGAVVDAAEAHMEDDGEEYEDNDVEMRSVSSDSEGSEEEEEDAEALAQNAANKSLWRKSLERIIPWGFGASTDNEEKEEEADDANEDLDAEEEEDENEEPAPLPVQPAQTPVRRVLGSFMTPQVHNPAKQAVSQSRPGIFPAAPAAPPGLPEPVPAAAPAPAPGPGRYSLGGGEARRIIVQQPWRVKDLVVPPPTTGTGGTASPARPAAMLPPATPSRDGATPTPAPRATPAVTAEERRAIQERRRSAVREVREDTFWKDGAPGMSPAKTSARMSLGAAGASPAKPAGARAAGAGEGEAVGSTTSVPRRPVFGSPTKGRALGFAIAEEGDSSEDAQGGTREEEDAEDEELDTRSLLDRMRETVEDMKRRRSIVASTPRPEAPALARATSAGPPTSVALASPVRAASGPFATGSVKKLDFSRIGSPALRAAPIAKETTDRGTVGEAGTTEEAEVQEEPFSLLRVPAREATPSSSRKLPSTGEREVDQKALDEQDVEDVRAVPLPVVTVEEMNNNEAEEAQEEEPLQKPKESKAKPRTRAKLLRAPRPAAAEEVAEEHESEPVDKTAQSQVKPKATRSRTAKSPAPPPVAEAESVLALAPPVTRRQRSKTPQPRPEEEVDSHATRSGTTRRTRKGTAEPEEPTPAPAKRGRKPAVEPVQEEEEKEVKTPAVKRGRKPRVAPVEEEHEEEVAAEAPAPVPDKRSRSRKAAAREPELEIQDGDELDSYEPQPESSTKQRSIPVKAAVKGRKKAAPIKQEPAGEEEVQPSAPLATTRSARTAAAKTPAPSKPAAPTSLPTKIAKPRGKLKTPASGPAAASRIASSSTSAANAEKENTHETTGSGSPASDEAEDAPVKVRVSRRTGAAAASALESGKAAKTAIPRSAPKTATRAAVKSKVKVEEDHDHEEAVRGRTTRVTRTRTKTG